MCGISGLWDYSAKIDLRTVLKEMGEKIFHRGPDDGGIWYDEEVGIGFSHRRLSISDLSSFGRQPMISKNKRWIISYNGEIYNSKDLLKQISEADFMPRGSSDTEILLEYISIFGLEQTLEKVSGMFAFSLWDSEQQSLYLIRDRLGIKPLYWLYRDGKVVFSSELKSIVLMYFIQKEINPEALYSLIHYGYISAPNSIYNDVFMLPPGFIAKFSKISPPAIYPYWQLENIVNSKPKTFCFNAEKYLQDLLRQVVEEHLIGDVEIGAFLSGGIDSTLMVLLMRECTNKPIKTFCVGFEDKLYDESHYARKIADHLGTDHFEEYITEDMVKEIVPKIPEIYDEPFADPSQIPTYFVSYLASQKVKAVISGDGGDELFGGYKRYLQGRDLSHFKESFLYKILPRNLTNFLAMNKFKSWGYYNVKSKADKFIDSQNYLDLYNILIDGYSRDILAKNHALGFACNSLLKGSFNRNPIEYFLYFDQKIYLPDDILTKVDRASMHHGLEVRVPFLDHRVVEFSWNIPIESKIYKENRKKILISLLGGYLPKSLYERPKMGFRAPIDGWLRRPLKEWAESLLEEDSQYFQRKEVLEIWKNHIEMKRDNSRLLWPLLMFYAWHKKWIS
jgi:asparagine synthase (glutamine-hydrolysing)